LFEGEIKSDYIDEAIDQSQKLKSSLRAACRTPPKKMESGLHKKKKPRLGLILLTSQLSGGRNHTK